MKQSDINITTKTITKQVKGIPNWKSPEPDGVQSHWMKKVTALRERIAKQMDNIISNSEDIPKWMTLSNAVFFVKKTLVKEMLLIITDQYYTSL